MTLDTILQEMNEIPLNQLEEVYEFIHSMTPPKNINERMRKKILSYAGAFSDMSEKDYSEFRAYLKKTREEIFTRDA